MDSPTSHAPYYEIEEDSEAERGQRGRGAQSYYNASSRLQHPGRVSAALDDSAKLLPPPRGHILSSRIASLPLPPVPTAQAEVRRHLRKKSPAPPIPLQRTMSSDQAVQVSPDMMEEETRPRRKSKKKRKKKSRSATTATTTSTHRPPPPVPAPDGATPGRKPPLALPRPPSQLKESASAESAHLSQWEVDMARAALPPKPGAAAAAAAAREESERDEEGYLVPVTAAGKSDARADDSCCIMDEEGGGEYEPVGETEEGEECRELSADSLSQDRGGVFETMKMTTGKMELVGN